MGFKHKEKFTGILLAAGTGKRFSAKKPKQFWEIEDGVSILEKSLEAIKPFAKEIIIALPQDFDTTTVSSDTTHFPKILSAPLGDGTSRGPKLITGGDTRQQSVINCLETVKTDFLFIHDAARPHVNFEDVKRLLERTLICKAAILAKPVTNTIKLCKKEDQNISIEKTIDRSTLWAAETPQAFETELFKKAMEKAKENNFFGTDDSSVIENYGRAVEIVESEFKNDKITFRDDLS